MKWRHSKEAQAQKDKDKEAGEKPSGGAPAADGGMGSSETVETELVGKDNHTLSAEQDIKLFGTKKIKEMMTHSWLHDRYVDFVFSIKEENLTMKTSLIEYVN